MIEPVAIDRDAASMIAAFTRVACPYDLLTTGSVERSLFDDPDPQHVLAIFDGGLEAVGAAVVRHNHGFIKLLAVHPRRQRRGIGTHLLRALEEWCRGQGVSRIAVGTSAPYYVTPGVDVRSTEALCFFEACGYERAGEAVNLGVRLSDLPPPGLMVRDATQADLGALLFWVRDHHPQWIDELSRGIDAGTCVVVEDQGFACYDVNRDGWFGPIASHPSSRETGVGTATLLGALHRMRQRGHDRAEIAWAEALPFYSKAVGARISRVFWSYVRSS